MLVPGLSSGVVAIAVGRGHTCVRTASGGIKCLGSNKSGELGNDSTSESYMVVDVVGY